MSTTTQPAEINGSYVTPDGKAQIDFGLTYRNGYAEFHASGYYDGSAGQCLEEIAKAYKGDATVHGLAAMHGQYHLKQINRELDQAWVQTLAAQNPARSFYDHQAQSFLTTNGLKLRATLSDSKPAPWGDEKHPKHHFRVCIWRDSAADRFKRGGRELSRLPNRLTFDFWSGSQPTPYSILACISSDAYTPDTFEEYCSEYGDNPDSLKAKQTFNRCASFARRLRAFFTPAELEQLSEIQ